MQTVSKTFSGYLSVTHITDRRERLNMSTEEIASDERTVLGRSGIVAAIGLLLATAIAHAECNSPGFNISGTFCNNCKYEGSMSVVHDQACQRPYRPNPNFPIVQFLSNRVIQRASHGIAGVNGTTFAYMPSKGYTGADEFAVEVAYRQGQDTGKFTVHFTVAVQ
jgi:hypothetical protein